jgi:hypothetical protein
VVAWRYLVLSLDGALLAVCPGNVPRERVRAWRIGHLIRALADKAQVAGITVTLVDEPGTQCRRGVARPNSEKPEIHHSIHGQEH